MRSCNPGCSGNRISVKYSERVFVAMRMRHVILSVACPALQYFSALSQKTERLTKKVPEQEMRVLIFSTAFFQNISHSKQNSARYDQKKYIGLHVKYSLFLLDFNETSILSTYKRKIFKYQIL